MHIESIMTPSAAKTYLRKLRGKTFFLSVSQQAIIKDEPGKCFNVIGNVEVSRAAALKFLTDTYSETLEKRGALVTIREYASCVFVG